jgi:hypothetical protein
MDQIRYAAKFAEEDSTKRAAHLLAIIRTLGWKSITDRTEKKPNMALARKYIRKNNKALIKLFGCEFSNLNTTEAHNIIDVLNPHIIHLWHAQIVGTIDRATIELLMTVTPDSSDS